MYSAAVPVDGLNFCFFKQFGAYHVHGLKLFIRCLPSHENIWILFCFCRSFVQDIIHNGIPNILKQRKAHGHTGFFLFQYDLIVFPVNLAEAETTDINITQSEPEPQPHHCFGTKRCLLHCTKKLFFVQSSYIWP